MSILQVATELSFWGPIVLFAIGVLSAIFNLIIFIGIKTFRQSPSVYYVVGQSLSDLAVLLVVLLQNIPSMSMSVSSISCKLNIFFSQSTVPCAMSFLCLSAFDRWACTSRSARVRQLSSHRVARRLFPLPFLFWSLISIPYLVFFDLIPYTFTCWYTNELFGKIAIYFLAPILSVLIPLIILIIISILTYRNIHLITNVHVQQNPIRNRLLMWEQQMTRMMIAQTGLNILCTLPLFICVIYSLATFGERAMRSFDRIVIELLVNEVATLIMEINFVSSFNIFFLSSPRLRKTIKIYLKRLWNCENNQIDPMNTINMEPTFTATQNQERQH